MIPLGQISYYHCVLNFLLTTRMDELNWTTVQPGAACAAALFLARNSADFTRANWKRGRLLKELLLRLAFVGFILNPRHLYWYKFVNYPFCSFFFSWIFLLYPSQRPKSNWRGLNKAYISPRAVTHTFEILRDQWFEFGSHQHCTISCNNHQPVNKFWFVPFLFRTFDLKISNFPLIDFHRRWIQVVNF